MEETQLQYVTRKLNEPFLNVKVVATCADVGISTTHAIRSGQTKNPSAMTIQKLYDFIRKIAD